MDRSAVLKQKELELAFKQRQLDLDLEQFKILQEIATLETAAKMSRSATPRDENIHSSLEQLPNPLSSTATATTASKQGAVIDLTVGEDIKIEPDDDDARPRATKRKRGSPEIQAADSSVEKKRTVQLNEQERPPSPDRRARAETEPSFTPPRATNMNFNEPILQEITENVAQPGIIPRHSMTVKLKVPNLSRVADKRNFPTQTSKTGIPPHPEPSIPFPYDVDKHKPSTLKTTAHNLTPRPVPMLNRGRRHEPVSTQAGSITRRQRSASTEEKETEAERLNLTGHSSPPRFDRLPEGFYKTQPRPKDRHLFNAYCGQVIEYMHQNARVPGNEITKVNPTILNQLMRGAQYQTLEHFLHHVCAVLMHSRDEESESKATKVFARELATLRMIWWSFRNESKKSKSPVSMTSHVSKWKNWDNGWPIDTKSLLELSLAQRKAALRGLGKIFASAPPAQ